MLLLKSIPLALLLTTPWFQANHKPTVKAQATKVYICTGPKAQVFHATSNCSGLSRCSGSIVSLTEAQARAKGRRPCKKVLLIRILFLFFFFSKGVCLE